MKIEAHLVEIQNQRTLTKAQDPDFFYVLLSVSRPFSSSKGME